LWIPTVFDRQREKKTTAFFSPIIKKKKTPSLLFSPIVKKTPSSLSSDING
jgi:hypothetical protein